jgi:hypothetical protein
MLQSNLNEHCSQPAAATSAAIKNENIPRAKSKIYLFGTRLMGDRPTR